MTNNSKPLISRRDFLSWSGFLPASFLLFGNARSLAAEPSADKRKIWNTLTDEQKAMVIKRWQEFKSLPPARQQELRQAEARFKSLTPDAQDRIRRNLIAWKQMAPAQKEKVRTNFSKWEKLNPAEKSKLTDRLQKWHELPEAKKEKLRRELRREK